MRWPEPSVSRAAMRGAIPAASARGLGLCTMANPEELRKQDQQLPKQQRKYPQSRVTQVMWLLIALVVVAAVVTAL